MIIVISYNSFVAIVLLNFVVVVYEYSKCCVCNLIVYVYCVSIQNKQTVLHIAAFKGHNKKIDYLIKNGVKIDDVDRVSYYYNDVCMLVYHAFVSEIFIGQGRIEGRFLRFQETPFDSPIIFKTA